MIVKGSFSNCKTGFVSDIRIEGGALHSSVRRQTLLSLVSPCDDWLIEFRHAAFLTYYFRDKVWPGALSRCSFGKF